MAGEEEGLSLIHQWIACGLTAFGSVVSAIGLWAALFAAQRARSAAEAAREARDSAKLLGRFVHMTDLHADTQELQMELPRLDFVAILVKTSRLRNKIARFKAEAYTDLSAADNQNLDLARDHLEFIGRQAATDVAGDETRAGRIQLAFATVSEALSRVVGTHSSRLG